MSWLRVQQTALLSVYCRRHSRKKTEALGPYRTGVSQQSHPPRLGALTCSTHTTSWHITCQNHMSVLMESSGWSTKHIVSGIVITGQGWVQTMNDSCAPHSALTLIKSDRGPWKGPQTLCSGWELTHQGSRNMVATLNPIRTHILMKTSRLLGTQATIITAGMKSWERQKRGFKVWNISLIIQLSEVLPTIRWKLWTFSQFSEELFATQELLQRQKPVEMLTEFLFWTQIVSKLARKLLNHAAEQGVK